jgi:hypothetical protein
MRRELQWLEEFERLAARLAAETPARKAAAYREFASRREGTAAAKKALALADGLEAK